MTRATIQGDGALEASFGGFDPHLPDMINKKCKYFPCHEHLEDCTFCYCPFYPCYRSDSGGYEIISSRTGKPVWSCSDCMLIHSTKNAKKVLEGLLKFSVDFDLITREQLLELLNEIINTGEN